MQPCGGAPIPGALSRPGRNSEYWKRCHTLRPGKSSSHRGPAQRRVWSRCGRSKNAASDFSLTMPNAIPIITLMTDFGLRDHYVAAMKGVILSICPDARIVDVTHEVSSYEVSEAAFLLSQTWITYPKKSVHVVVVDPG